MASIYDTQTRKFVGSGEKPKRQPEPQTPVVYDTQSPKIVGTDARPKRQSEPLAPATGDLSGINAQPNSPSTGGLPADNIDRGVINVGPSANTPESAGVSFPEQTPFNLAGPSPNIQMPESAAGGIASGASSPTTTGTATNVERATPVDPNEGRTAIKTRHGTIWATPEQEKNWNSAAARDVAENERKKKYEAAVVRAKEIGRQNTATNQAESNQRYAAFRQGLAQREMNQALDPSQFGGVGRGSAQRGGQAMVESYRWAGAAAGGAMPKIGEDVQTPYGAFRQGSMGRFSPLRDANMPFGQGGSPSSGQRGGPQPARPIQPASSPFSLTPQAAMPSAFAPASLSLTGKYSPALYNFPS
jgi:hypothetical protein